MDYGADGDQVFDRIYACIIFSKFPYKRYSGVNMSFTKVTDVEVDVIAIGSFKCVSGRLLVHKGL